MDKAVTVIIPTYNRSNILPKTIPSYIQQGVGEVIVVDDCSIDNTQFVVEGLQEVYPEIRYMRLNENRKQAFAKNQGIRAATMPYLYFGDDDSILIDGSINTLLNDLKRLEADIIGAKALYMDSLSDMDDLCLFIQKNDIYSENVSDIIDLHKFQVNFALSYKEAVEVPFTQASFLIRAELAKKVLYDDTFVGNAYREETDFLIRANQMGAKIYYQSKAVQVNLPRSACPGGAHSNGRLYWYLSSIKNNWKFLNKNYPYLKQRYNLSKSMYTLQLMFIKEFLSKGAFNFSRGVSRSIFKTAINTSK